MTSEISKDGKAAKPFITDLEPLFFGRPITYVDVGAHNGSVFRQLLTSSFYVREAHLIEPNPRTFEALQLAVADIDSVNRMACLNVALGASAGSVTMRDEDAMTHIVPEPSDDAAATGLFEVDTTTLDDLAEQCQIGHINLLKIDVEGHELSVIEGAKQKLAAEAVDVVYIEAGMNPGSEQHAYYRAIEDALHAHGYRIFRFYEQRNEWLDDSLLLRRTNIAFVSSSFAEQHPYKLSRELVRLRKKSGELEAQVASLQEQLSTKAALEQERDAAVAKAVAAAEELAKARHDLAKARHDVGTIERLVGERDAFVEYANELELRYLRVLSSKTWRVMGPVRVVGRTLRRLRGRSPAKRNRLPKRPTL